ncbi:MAG: B12-binding domain-containing protein [Planctomycetota bacterium]
MTQIPSQAMFTPKQVAIALGVSESSVKRWCDNGRLRAGRTAGGHRKLPMAAVVELVRKTGQEIADPAALGMVAVSARRKPSRVQDELYNALLAGNEAAVRELLLGLYQQGATVIELGDELVSPVFRRIGDGWQQGVVSVHEERRSCEVAMAVLHELRRWVPDAAADAPLAMAATPQRDFAEVPIRLVELLLLASGWRTLMAGSGLPVEEIVHAVRLRDPRLLCVSATHLEDADAYVEQHNRLLAPLGVPVIVGGGAFACDHAKAIKCDRFAAKLGDLAEWLDNQAAQSASEAAE